MKKIILLVSLILLFSLPSCGGSNTTEKKESELKFAVVLPLSGDFAEYGESIRQGLDLVEGNANKKLKFTYIDDNNSLGISDAVKTAVNKDKVKGVIVCSLSDKAYKVISLMEEVKLPFIVASSTTNFPVKEESTLYKITVSDDFIVKSSINFIMSKLKIKKVAVLYNIGDITSKTQAEKFKESFTMLGGAVTEFISYKGNSTDYTDYLKKIRDSGAELVFLTDFYKNNTDIMSTSMKIGYNPIFYGTVGFDIPKIYTNSNFSNCYYCTEFSSADMLPTTTEFKQKFKEKYSREPDSYSALSYDAGKLLEKVLPAMKSSKSKDSSNLFSDVKAEGTTGKIIFESDKTVKKSIDIVKLNSGKIQVADKYVP